MEDETVTITTSHRLRPTLSVIGTIVGTGALVLSASPALARPTITETEVPATAGRQVLHLRIQTGCGDAATDAIEMTIPESVIGVLP